MKVNNLNKPVSILRILCSRHVQVALAELSKDGQESNAGACSSLGSLQGPVEPFGSLLSTETIEHKKDPTWRATPPSAES
jgi:hypothetical protein